jgi:molecular chaperone DnaK (HSP70)
MRINAQQAAEDFLNALKLAATETYSFQSDEITLSVPIESFEYYQNWLMSLTDRHHAEKIRIVDEASAAAAGYGKKFIPGSFPLVDFGGSTMQTAITIAEESRDQ